MEGCLTWQAIKEKFPWDVILLLGGGFSIALATKESGLSLVLRENLLFLSTLPPIVSCLGISIVISLFTEFISNITAATIIKPVLLELSLSLKVNPIYFLMSAAVSCSFAFMFPVATAPNAIIYQASNMKVTDMVRYFKIMLLLSFSLISFN